MKKELLDQREFNRLKEIKKRHRDSLFSLPNVNGVGIGLKEVNGERTDEIAIRVYVVKKVTRARLKEGELVPSEIEGIITDVIEIGETRLLAHLDRERPVKGGARIGRCDGEVGAGTMGGACFYDNGDNTRVLLTNNHCLTYVFDGHLNIYAPGDPIAQPAPAEGGSCPGDKFATIKRIIPLFAEPFPNLVDAGTAEIVGPPDEPTTEYASDEIHDVGIPVGYRDLTPDDIGVTRVQKSGSTTGLTSGSVIDIAFDITTSNPYGGPDYLLEDQILTAGMISAGGDSGSLVLDLDKNIVGLLWGAGPDGILAYASPIGAVLSELDIRFELTGATTSTSTTTSTTSTSTTTITTSTSTITVTSTSSSTTTISTSTTTISTSTSTTTGTSTSTTATSLSTSTSTTTMPAPNLTTQLAMILDGSGSITSANWTVITDGLADAVEDSSCLPDDGSAELMVIQFAGAIAGDARVEVSPTVIDSTATAVSVATMIRAISQGRGLTPMAKGIHLAADTMAASPHFDTSLKQVLNLTTDGVPNVCDPTWACPSYKINTVSARDYAISTLSMTTNQDEFNVEGIGISSSNRDWLKDNIVYPQPGSLAPPYVPGWVRVVANAEEYADTICRKIAAAVVTAVARTYFFWA